MQRGSKNISSSLRPNIDRIKSYIMSSERPFDGDGYVFKTALKELRKLGLNFKYVSEKCHYIKVITVK